LISAIKTIQEIYRAQDLQAYSRHPKIAHKFGEKYSIKISFSLHTGRSYEGAIGSEYKVDAIFVSKEVQVCLRLDELCDVYNREILLTAELYMMLSEKAKNLTRKIESVVMKEQPKVPLVSKTKIDCRRKYIVVTFTQVNLCQQIFSRTLFQKTHSVPS
jgi:hypothetical protein